MQFTSELLAGLATISLVLLWGVATWRHRPYQIRMAFFAGAAGCGAMFNLVRNGDRGWAIASAAIAASLAPFAPAAVRPTEGGDE
jgi:hypothetical protein